MIMNLEQWIKVFSVCMCVRQRGYSMEICRAAGREVQQREERKSSREKMTERCRSREAEAVAFLRDEH